MALETFPAVSHGDKIKEKTFSKNVPLKDLLYTCISGNKERSGEDALLLSVKRPPDPHRQDRPRGLLRLFLAQTTLKGSHISYSDPPRTVLVGPRRFRGVFYWFHWTIFASWPTRVFKNSGDSSAKHVALPLWAAAPLQSPLYKLRLAMSNWTKQTSLTVFRSAFTSDSTPETFVVFRCSTVPSPVTLYRVACESFIRHSNRF